MTQGILVRVLLIIFFLLFPSVVFGGIGDLYYCKTKKVIGIKNSKLKQFKNFIFKFERNQNSLKFGNEKNFFSKYVLSRLEFQSDEWFVYNDTQVFNLDEKKIFNNHPYCLFYRRV